jgi:hypothetical protein
MAAVAASERADADPDPYPEPIQTVSDVISGMG